MIDGKNTAQFAQSLAPAARNATANGTGVDTANMGSVTALFEVGAITDGTHTPVLQHSADNSSWADVPAGSLVGSLVAATANTVQAVGYIGTLRYVRARITVTGATTGALSSAAIVGGSLRKAP